MRRVAALIIFLARFASAGQDRLVEQIEALQRFIAAADYASAERVAAHLLSEVERFGPQHPAAALAWNQVGLLNQTLGRYEEAERIYSRGIRALEGKKLTPPGFESLLINLAVLYLEARDRPAQAELLCRKALRMAEQQPNFEQERGRFYSVLGGARLAQGDLKGARQHFEQALSFGGDRRVDRLERASVLANLGVLAAAEEQSAPAKEYFERAAALLTEISGPASPDLAEIYLNLAVLHQRLKRWASAAEYAARARQNIGSSVGDRHPLLADILSVWATALRHTGRGNEAKVLEKQRRVILATQKQAVTGQTWIHMADLKGQKF